MKKYEHHLLAEEASLCEGSEAQRKREAQCSLEYQTFLTGFDKARVDYNINLGKVNALELKLSALQTISKLILAEIKLTPQL